MGDEEASEPKEMKQPVKPDMEDHVPPHTHDAAEENVIPVPEIDLNKFVWEEKKFQPLMHLNNTSTLHSQYHDEITAAEPVKEKSPNNRDSALARVETEKRLALVKAWEENEKAKVDNKAYKKISAIGSWENTKKADVDAQLRSFEEKLEKKKAGYAERMKNKVAELHKEAEEKRAMVEAKKGEEFLKIEETAAKYRSTGYTPKNFLACFSS